MRVIDLTGKRFGRWTVLRFTSRENRRTLWLCRCDCGVERDVLALSLTRSDGNSRSCGCLAREESSLRAPSLAHGASRKTSPVHREYRIWKNMHSRCSTPSAKAFERYGGRGITVCDRWRSFENFIADMGPAPTREHTLDRVDNVLGYEPGNCRWATQTQQQRNRTNNKLDEHRAAEIRSLVAGGMSHGSTAKRFGVSKKLVTEIVAGRAWKPRAEQPGLFDALGGTR